VVTKSRFADVPIDQCVVAENVRSEPGDVTDLADSIRRYGILQPLSGCASSDGRHVEIFMGQRRLTAARVVGLATVPVQLRQRPGGRTRVLEQLEENRRRAEMSCMDEALAFRRLADEGMTQAEIGKAVGLTPARIEQYLYLLTLPRFVQHALHVGDLVQGVTMEVPRAFWRDKAAVKRLREIGATRGGVRLWLQEQVEERIIRGEALSAKHWRTWRVSLHPEAYRLAEALAAADGTTLPVFVDGLIRAAYAKKKAA
jgi:ParB/RepB/Spo0J family partition protein